MSTIHSIPSKIQERLGRVTNASYNIQRYMSGRRRNSAIKKARSSLETLAEIALLLESRAIRLAGLWETVADHLADAGCDALIVARARGHRRDHASRGHHRH